MVSRAVGSSRRSMPAMAMASMSLLAARRLASVQRIWPEVMRRAEMIVSRAVAIDRSPVEIAWGIARSRRAVVRAAESLATLRKSTAMLESGTGFCERVAREMISSQIALASEAAEGQAVTVTRVAEVTRTASSWIGLSSMAVARRLA